MDLITTCIFIRSISAVLLPITEEALLDANGVPTGELVGLTEGLVRAQERLHFLLLGELITVLHSPLPVTGLLLQVKRQTGRAADGLQTLGIKALPPMCLLTHRCSALDHVPAGVASSLQAEQLAGALVLAELRLVGLGLFIVLTKNPCKMGCQLGRVERVSLL